MSRPKKRVRRGINDEMIRHSGDVIDVDSPDSIIISDLRQIVKLYHISEYLAGHKAGNKI